jgi:hypothetical protein
MERPELGSWHIVSAIVRKRTIGTGDHQDWRKNYPVKTIQERIETDPIRAMYIGMRTLHEGVTSLEYEEDSFKPYPVFERKQSRPVLVFISDERTNPFFALSEDVHDPEWQCAGEIQQGGKWKKRLPLPDFQWRETVYVNGNSEPYSIDDMQWDDEQWMYYIEGAMVIVTADHLSREKPVVEELVKIPTGFLF